MSRRIVAAIAIVITAVWALSFVISAIDHSFRPPTGVQPAMMLVAGAAFGHLAYAGRRENGK